jgi:Flp pilus assembly protein TadD
VAVVRIIQTCKSYGAAFLGLILTTAHIPAFAATEPIDKYVDARLAEIGNKDSLALTRYLDLFKTRSDSPVLADRLFTTALRNGDMQSALRAVRAQELRNAASPEAPLLLYADALKRKDWAMARVAAAELQAKSNFAFMTPILLAWTNVGQGKAPALEGGKADQLFEYYAIDQKIYLHLAMGNMGIAKEQLLDLTSNDGAFIRDLVIRITPIFAAKGDQVFATRIITNLVEKSYVTGLTQKQQTPAVSYIRPEEAIAALHTRLASALLEQKNPDQALYFARIANWLAPDSDPARLVLAQALVAANIMDNAQTILVQITDKSPYATRAISERIKLLSAGNDYRAAIALAQSAKEARNGASNMTLLLAQTLEDAGELKAAIAIYQTLVSEADTAIAPPKQRALYRLLLATVEDKNGDWNSARKHLEMAKTLDPQNAYILNYLGYTLLQRGEEIEHALGLVKMAFQLTPDSIAITDSLGWGYALSGQSSLAVPLLEKAVKAAGNDLAINEHMGDAYWLSGRFIDARYAWRIASQKATDKDADRLAGKIDIGLTETQKHP